MANSVVTNLMTNNVDPDQLASSEAKFSDLELHCLQRQGISGFSRIRVIQIPSLFTILVLQFEQIPCYHLLLCAK